MKHNNRLFLKLFWSYIIIVTIPIIIVGIITSGFLFAGISKDTRTLNLNILEQIKNSIDERIESVMDIRYQMQIHDTVVKLMSDDDTDSYDLWLVSKSINQYQVSKDIVENVCIYIKRKNIIIDEQSAYTPEEYYNKYLRGGDYDFRQWVEIIDHSSRQPVLASASSPAPALIVWPLSNSYMDEGGAFIVSISRDAVIEKLSYMGARDNWSFAIVDRHGNDFIKTDHFDYDFDLGLIADENGEFMVGGNTVIYNTSRLANLRYISVFPRGALSGAAGVATVIFISLILLGLIASIFAANIGAKRMTRPMLEILDKNKALTADMNEHILLKFLYDMSLNENEKKIWKQNDRIPFNKKEICVAAVGVSGTDEAMARFATVNFEAAWQESNRIISRLLEEVRITHHSIRADNSRYVYILNYDDAAALKSILEKILHEFNEKYQISLNIGVGTAVDAIEKIYKSYDEAVTALRYGNGEELVYYTDIKNQESNRIYYTVEKELALIRNIKVGSKENTGKILEEIYNVNYCEKKLSQSLLKRLINNISLTVYKVLDDMYANDADKYEKFGRICSNISKNDHVEECFEILREICMSLCEDISRQTNHDDLKTKALKYISENYMDKNMSLDMLAEHTGFKYNYFSRLFKEAVGSTFIDYLITFRLEKAREMLDATNLSVEQIAQQTGFNDSNALIKTFKKYYTITPGQYKKKK